VTNTGTPVPGTINGTAFDDLSGNGALDPGEPGIGNVTVSLLNATNTVIATTTTAADGSYQFTSVVPGTYTVRETDPTGYISTTTNTVPITLPPAGTSTANFGDQQLGSVSGSVFNDPNGSGVRDLGEGGLGAVTITLIDATTSAIVATTTTAADGFYSFTGVAPGSYRVQETDPNGYVSTTSNLVPISVASGGSPIVTFGDQALGTVGGTVFDDLNGNGVQDLGEPGIAGATVKLVDPTTGAVIVTTTTTASGTYLFTGVTPGTYNIVETDPSGYVSTTVNTLPVSVPAGGSASAQFGDQRLGTVSGVTFSDLNGNGVQDPGEPGTAGVTVTLINPTTAAVVATMTTGPTGLYTFTNVAPGSYIVQETDPAGVVSTTPNTVPISLASGGAATANFGDEPEGIVAGTVFNDLNGNGVRDPAESGMDGVTVRLIDPITGTTVFTTTTASDGTYVFDSVTPNNYLVAETDPSGFVSTTTNLVAVTVPAGGSASAQFGDQQVGTISGVVFNDLNGSTLREAGEAGIGGVSISLINPTTGAVLATTTTAGDGSYLFFGITAGTYTVQETDPNGFVSTTTNAVPVTVPGGGATTANFGDQAKGTVAGSVFNDLNGTGVQDPGEAGIGSVTVSLINPTTGAVIATTTTAGDGSYLFPGITPGSYTVRETDPNGYVSTTANLIPITVPPGGAANAQFGDQQVGTITGIVFNDANGSGVQNAGEQGLGGITVELINATTGAVIRTTTTAADGTYVFSSVPPGSYIVRETDRSGYVSTTSNTAPVTLPSGGSASANFGDQQLGALSSVSYNDLNHNGVQDPGEPGLAGSTITLINPSTGAVVGTATTGSDGSYLIGGVPVGTYTAQETDPAGYVSSTSNTVQVTISGTSPASATFGNYVPAPTPTRTPTLTPTNTPAPPPDLVLDKRHSGSFRVGRTGIYTLTVTNVGSGPASGMIMVTDVLPVGMTFSSATGTNWSCGGVGPTVTCVRNTAIPPGSFTTISLTVKVSSRAAAVTVNTATVATDGDTNLANNTASDSTNVMGSTTTLATPTPIISPTTQPSTPPATPTPRQRPAKMGVRLVAVGRVPASSVMYYTVAVVLIGKGIVPDVRASLILPPEVQFLSTDLPPTTAPQVGSSGVLTWQLGDMSSYPNQPFHVAALVRPDLAIGHQFWGELTVTNGTGFVTTKRRKSYVGNGNLH
jgi:protocatechuate 3,4-dioxygenase beta subunit